MLRSVAARRERRRFHSQSALRCVSKHEGKTESLVLILRDARTRVRIRGAFSTYALLRTRTSIACCKAHHTNSPSRCRGTRWLVRSLYFPVFLQIRNLPSPVSRSQTTRTPSFPRRIFAPGVCIVASPTPNRGVGGAPRVVRVQRHPLGVHITRHARRLARRLASHDAGRSPLGAPPWRFWASGPRFRLLRRPPSYNGGQLPSGSVQRAPRSQVVVPGGRGPGPPGANGYKPPPQDATPRSAFRMSPDDALNERGCECPSMNSLRSQECSWGVVTRGCGIVGKCTIRGGGLAYPKCALL